MKQPQVPIVKITFDAMPDFIFSVEQWQSEGGYRGIIKQGIVRIIDIKKVVYGQFMDFNKFHSLEAWEG